MNHEFWNEIGNLYFMCGAYEPAIHAYLRSIKLENTFGRSYNNLAMAYVQTGKYQDAIQLYRRSIELLSDEKEKAATWNRLGILYRQIKEYDNAVEAYQRADLIAPHEDSTKAAAARADANQPLAVSMPEIDMSAILAKGNLAKWQASNLLAEINAEFELAESLHDMHIIDEETATAESDEAAAFEPPVQSQSAWRLAYTEASLAIEKPVPVEVVQKILPVEVEELNIIIPVEMQSESTASEITAEAQAAPVEIVEEIEPMKNETFLEQQVHIESIETITSEASEEATQYSQVEYPLTDISPEEQQTLKLTIIKYQEETGKNPNSYILWEELGEAYKSAGKYRDAMQAFQRAISLNPRNYMCHYRLGLVYAAERREQEAVNAFQKVLEINPNSVQAHASLASQYRKMGLEEAAQAHIEKARGTQFDEQSEYNRACLEAICGNSDRALELLGVALESKQTYVAWAQNDPDFDSLRGDQRFQALLSTHAIAA